MELEAVDEGTIGKILVAEGTDNVKVGAVIAILAEEGEDASAVEAPTKSETPQPVDPAFKGSPDPSDPNKTGSEAKPAERNVAEAEDHGRPAAQTGSPASGDRVKASPLARRIAADKGIDLGGIAGSGPNGRIVKADVEGA
ncbi:E3 binding domain-containing protein, partial [Escherichia coli]|nr:E3 binding domain-containing protein [Escherichia coli]